MKILPFVSLCAALVVALLVPRVASALPQDLDVFTDFEDVIPNTDPGEILIVGPGPETAALSGDAFAGVVGIGQLYRSGFRAWMVQPLGLGVIAFAPDAAEVEFWAKAHSAAGASTVITAFERGGAAIGSPVMINPGAGFQLVSFTGSIASIEVENLSSVQLNGIDDFGFTPVPEPHPFWLGTAGVVVLAALRLRRRSA